MGSGALAPAKKSRFTGAIRAIACAFATKRVLRSLPATCKRAATLWGGGGTIQEGVHNAWRFYKAGFLDE